MSDKGRGTGDIKPKAVSTNVPVPGPWPSVPVIPPPRPPSLLLLLISLFLICGTGQGAQFHPQAFGWQEAVEHYPIVAGESLLEVARRFNLGFNSIVAANPWVDLYLPPAGTVVTIPQAWIVPDSAEATDILINLPELRLYLFPSGQNGSVITFPVGIGDEGKDTPTGIFTIVEKRTRPTWFVPPSIRRDRPALPRVIPPGPDNPLGSHALRLSQRSILIHGTDKPWGIGRRSSYGCIRLYPEDIQQLFRMVGKGSRVTIINQAVKTAVTADGKIFVEVHRYDDRNYLAEALQQLTEADLVNRVDLSRLLAALRNKRGLPEEITLT